MLSLEQQKMMISMLETPMTFDNNGFYDNRRSFMRAVSYLVKNGIVWKKDGKFILSYKGEILGKLFASFTDVDKTIRQKYGSTHWT